MATRTYVVECILACSLLLSGVRAQSVDDFPVGSFGKSHSSSFSSSSASSQSSASSSSSSLNYNVRSELEPLNRGGFITPGTGPLKLRDGLGYTGNTGSLGSTYQTTGSGLGLGSQSGVLGNTVGSFGSSSGVGSSLTTDNRFGALPKPASITGYGGISAFDRTGSGLGGTVNGLGSSSVSFGVGGGSGLSTFGSSDKFKTPSLISGNRFGAIPNPSAIGAYGGSSPSDYTGSLRGNLNGFGSNSKSFGVSGSESSTFGGGNPSSVSSVRFGGNKQAGSFTGSGLGGGNIVGAGQILGSNSAIASNPFGSGGNSFAGKGQESAYNLGRYGTKGNNFNNIYTGTVGFGTGTSGLGSASFGDRGTYSGGGNVIGSDKGSSSLYNTDGSLRRYGSEGKLSNNAGTIFNTGTTTGLSNEYDNTGKYYGNTGIGSGSSRFGSASGLYSNSDLGRLNTGSTTGLSDFKIGTSNSFSGIKNPGIKDYVGNYQATGGSSSGNLFTGLRKDGVNNVEGTRIGSYGNIGGRTENVAGSSSFGIGGSPTRLTGLGSSGSKFGLGGSTGNLDTFGSNSGIGGLGNRGNSYRDSVQGNTFKASKTNFGGSDSNLGISSDISRIKNPVLSGGGSFGFSTSGNTGSRGIPSRTSIFQNDPRLSVGSSLSGTSSGTGVGGFGINPSSVSSGRFGVPSTSSNTFGSGTFIGTGINKDIRIGDHLFSSDKFDASKPKFGSYGNNLESGSGIEGSVRGIGSGSFGVSGQRGIASGNVINPVSNTGSFGSAPTFGSALDVYRGSGNAFANQRNELKGQGSSGTRNFGSGDFYSGFGGTSNRNSFLGAVGGSGNGFTNTKYKQNFGSGLYTPVTSGSVSNLADSFGSNRGSGYGFGGGTIGSNQYTGSLNNDGIYRGRLGGGLSSVSGNNESKGKYTYGISKDWDSTKRLTDSIVRSDPGNFGSTRGSGIYGSVLDNRGQTGLSPASFDSSLKQGSNYGINSGSSGTKNYVFPNTGAYGSSTGTLSSLSDRSGLGIGTNKFGSSTSALNANAIGSGSQTLSDPRFYGISSPSSVGPNRYSSNINQYGTGINHGKLVGSIGSLGGSAGHSANIFSSASGRGGNLFQYGSNNAKADGLSNRLEGGVSSSSNRGLGDVYSLTNYGKQEYPQYGKTTGNLHTSSFGSSNIGTGFSNTAPTGGAVTNVVGIPSQSVRGSNFGTSSGSSSFSMGGNTGGYKGDSIPGLGSQGNVAYGSSVGSAFTRRKGSSDSGNFGSIFGQGTDQTSSSKVRFGSSGNIDNGIVNKGFEYYGGSGLRSSGIGFPQSGHSRVQLGSTTSSLQLGQDSFSHGNVPGVNNKFDDGAGSILIGGGSASGSFSDAGSSIIGHSSRFGGSVPESIGSSILIRESNGQIPPGRVSFGSSFDSEGALSGSSGIASDIGSGRESSVHGGSGTIGYGFVQPSFGGLSTTGTVSSTHAGIAGSGRTKSLRVTY